MRRKLTQQRAAEPLRQSSATWPPPPRRRMRRRDFLSRTAYAAGLAGAAASLPLNLLLGEAAKRAGARGRAAHAEQHADRPLRRPDDGEPLVRPLLRLAAERRRRAGPHLPRPRQRQRAGQHAPRLDARAAASGRAAATPTPTTPGTAAARSSAARAPNTRGAGRLPRGRQRRVRALLLRRGRPRLHPPGGPGVHGLRPLPLLADGPRRGPTATTSGRRSRAGSSNNNPPADTLGNQWETLFDRALKQPGNLPGQA